ncbi:MAG: hypothetical protein LQ344_000188 [Seirophora lacunosa]|nr:MAG: hypothetical protein LQ344_000188 [Seirophora lacunosa]
MDLDDELDDFDGANYDDDFDASDECLPLQTKSPKEQCRRNSFSLAHFFADAPWLDVPVDRQGEILIEPLYPRGGLLGGSSSQGGPKVSKLAALAAARKKKENERSSVVDPLQPNASVALLARLKNKDPSNETDPAKGSISYEEKNAASTPPKEPPQSRKYLSRRAKGLHKEASGAKPAKKSTQTPTNDKETNGLAQGIAEVAIEESSKPKSKNLDVLVEFQKSRRKHAVNFVVIGHVDAGKSTLMGRLLYDMHVVDQRAIDKYQKEAERIGKASFALAWVLDQGTEERSRGVTIDIAMNKFETENTSFTILDAPGHRDFIPNMIAGASQADFAVLVIDASTGSFESGLRGQTKEHALLVRSMGVQRMVVVINKLDTVQWSRDRFDEIRQQISAFLTTAGFLAKNIVFVPCSGLTGDNIARRADNSQASWYTGPILLEALESSDPTNRALDKPLRLTIADVFRGGVQNPLSISGRLDSGSLQVGDRVIAMPASETATIKGIEVDSEPTDWAVAGQNVILHLTDIEQKYLKPGDVLCSPSTPIKNITSFTVKILAFDHVTPMHVEVHRGRLHVPGRITHLVAVLDKGTGAVTGKKKPKLVQPGAVARVVVEVETAVPLEAPGRVVLRAGGETVAAGLLE